LGLDQLDLSEGLFTVQSVSEVSKSHRADAEYYKQKYYNLLRHIEKRSFSVLQEITSFSGGATPLGADYLEEGIPFLRIQNIGDNRLVLDDVAYVDESIHNNLLKRSQIAPNDVLLTITGRIGTAAVVSDEIKTGNINQHIVRMRLASKAFNPYYLAAFMNSVGGRLQTERESYGTTRDALPYYCLAKILVLQADMGLQKQIELLIRKADETDKEAKSLLAEAKEEVEKLIEGD
jgi:restriction endonuclease S subunit